jgi:DNA repair photolyase
MSIRAYTGEYLTSPVAVHLGLNWCTHNCFYCFANLNNPERRADYSDVNSLLRNVAQRNAHLKNLPTRLVLAGHPILASNDSDPFAKSNYQQLAPIWEAFQDMGVSMVFQTRGGDQAIATLEKAKPTMVYVSFTSDQEATIKRAEPGAPSHAARKALILAAKAAGHHVVVGLNPFVPEWWDNFEDFAGWLAEHGFGHVWFGELHLNHMQVANIREKAKEDFAQVIEFAQARKRHDPGIAVARWHMEQAGINVFSGATSSKGMFWQPYFDLGFPFFPTLDHFFAELREEGPVVAFTFDAFNAWADPHPELTETSAFKDYLVSIGRSLRNVGFPDKAYSFKEVHEVLWMIDRFPTKMRHDDIFLLSEDGTVLTDDNDRPILVYAPGRTDPKEGRIDVSEVTGYVTAEGE